MMMLAFHCRRYVRVPAVEVKPRKEIWLGRCEVISVRAEHKADTELRANGVGAMLDTSGNTEQIARVGLELLDNTFFGTAYLNDHAPGDYVLDLLVVMVTP